MRHATAGAAIALLCSVLPATARAVPPAEDPADTKPARPPLPPTPPPEPLRWGEHLEVGAGLSIVATPGSRAADGSETNVRLLPGAGFHIRLSWEVLRYLWFTAYLTEARRPLDLPRDALGVPGQLEGSAWMYSFGARVSPTLPIGSRVRLWITAGAGWGRVGYGRLCPDGACDQPLVVRERSANLVEVPLGGGASFEIIPRWLRIHAELTASLLPSQTGDALQSSQTVDAAGKIRNVGPMPHLDALVVQTIGLSLVL